MRDSHLHLDFFDDPAAVVARARAAGVTGLLAIGIGQGPDTMHRALDLAHAHGTAEFPILASAGVHPQQANLLDADSVARLRVLAAEPLCVAIGEIGLDFYHADNPDPAVQRRAFEEQMAVAAELRKPILIHLRTSELATPAVKARFEEADAAEDLLRLLERVWAPTGLPGVLHCFSGTAEQARRALALGFSLSFAGNLTYARSERIQAVAREAPADRILIETDAPFLAPIPHRGERNEPALIGHTAAFLADLRGIATDALVAQTTANFERLFPLAAAV